MTIPVNQRYLILSVAIAAIGLCVWRYVFVPVGFDVIVDPPELVPDGSSQAVVSIVLANRVGTRVPWKSGRLHCVLDQGAGLVSVRYNADSTSVTLTAGNEPGQVVMRVYSGYMPGLAVEVVIPVRMPMALLQEGGAVRAAAS
jgi:hypothetical protein